jgi:hypothetical protein
LFRYIDEPRIFLSPIDKSEIPLDCRFSIPKAERRLIRFLFILLKISFVFIPLSNLILAEKTNIPGERITASPPEGRCMTVTLSFIMSSTIKEPVGLLALPRIA